MRTTRFAMFIYAGAAAGVGLMASPPAALSQIYVKNYHNDINRTGWNPGETSLTVSSIGNGGFHLQHSVALDEQVDGQPLYVQGQSIGGTTHNVAYVATENNTVYAIDADSGAVILSRNLGTPVPASTLPGGCNNNSAVVGINSTPVISSVHNTIWVIAYTYENSQPVFRLHALNLGTLADNVSPKVVTASGKLADGSTYTFNPYASRQRAALTYVNDSIYAPFASFCDVRADISRGWLLGWNAYSLAPFAANNLTNKSVGTPNNFYLSSIWMSGYGIATLQGGSPFVFVTGNADYSGTTYNSKTNLAESVVKISPDLSQVEDYFTPANEPSLDNNDTDFGSGGAMVVPTQPGPNPRMVVAAGKDGNMFLIDRTRFGGYNPGGSNRVLGTYRVGGCWCGPSYFVGADGVGRVVSSGGNNAIVWRFNNSGATAHLVKESTTPTLTNGQDGGFFTSISSNGTQAGTAVIWGAGRPVNSNPANVLLYAFDASNGTQLYSGVAGTWPYTNGTANIVPTIANGHAYVASYKELAIFGTGAPAAPAPAEIAARRSADRIAANSAVKLAPGEHEIYGIVRKISASGFTAHKRDDASVTVDMRAALLASEVAVPTLGHGVLVRGRYDINGVLIAGTVLHAKRQRALWPADR